MALVGAHVGVEWHARHRSVGARRGELEVVARLSAYMDPTYVDGEASLCFDRSWPIRVRLRMLKPSCTLQSWKWARCTSQVRCCRHSDEALSTCLAARVVVHAVALATQSFYELCFQYARAAGSAPFARKPILSRHCKQHGRFETFCFELPPRRSARTTLSSILNARATRQGASPFASPCSAPSAWRRGRQCRHTLRPQGSKFRGPATARMDRGLKHKQLLFDPILLAFDHPRVRDDGRFEALRVQWCSRGRVNDLARK